MLVIRPALPADIPALAVLGRKTFAENFGHLYLPQHLAAYLDVTYSEDKLSTMLKNDAITHFVAEEAGSLLGYAMAGECKLPVDLRGLRSFELHRLYVDTPHHGRGIGARLMEQVLAMAQALQTQAMYLGVWENNLRAQEFYARYGFEPCGEYAFHVGPHTDRELIFRKLF